MLMNDKLKKGLVLLLFMVVIIGSPLVTPNRVHAKSGVNLALNPAKTGYPEVTASYTCGCDSAWSTVNGILSYSESPRDRWTNYGSSNANDWLTVDFGSAKSFNQVKLFVYNDGGGVQAPASYLLQYWNGSGWTDIPNPTKTPEIPAAALNSVATPATTLNTVDFDAVTSSKLQIVFTNKSGSYSGLVELEVLHKPTADETAATAVMAAIEQLPIQAAIVLSDKPAIAAARTAYENLSAIQKSLLTNLSKLIAADAAIEALEFTDVDVISAFGHAAGNAVTLKLSSVLDITYSIPADHFQIRTNGVQVTVADAVYDTTDPRGQSIKLTLSSPALLNETSVDLSLLSGAIKTSDHKFNNSVHSIPVLTFKNLDLTLDNWFGVDDVVQFAGNFGWIIGENQDEIFVREYIKSLLGQITAQFVK